MVGRRAIASLGSLKERGDVFEEVERRNIGCRRQWRQSWLAEEPLRSLGSLFIINVNRGGRWSERNFHMLGNEGENGLFVVKGALRSLG